MHLHSTQFFYTIPMEVLSQSLFILLWFGL